MTITVVGSIAYDAVTTPAGARDRMLGGAATHFALAASYFDAVRVVGSVGDDFAAADLALLGTRGTNVDDVERVPGGRTFSWRGAYGPDVDTRETLDTQLGVFAGFSPRLSPAARACDVLFLANIDPRLQLAVRAQCEAARFVALDSMDLWIETARADLLAVIAQVDCVLLNDAELRQLTGAPELVAAAHVVLGWGPSAVVAKRGRHGAVLVTAGGRFAQPAYPVATVVDPTGAGDTFAGGLVGHVACHLDGMDDDVLRRAMAHGTALASFNVEAFGTERMVRLGAAEVRERVAELQASARSSEPDLRALSG